MLTVWSGTMKIPINSGSLMSGGALSSEPAGPTVHGMETLFLSIYRELGAEKLSLIPPNPDGQCRQGGEAACRFCYVELLEKRDQMDNETFIVMGRRRAQDFTPPEGEKWIAISITDPGSEPAALREGFTRIERFSFEDIENPIFGERVGMSRQDAERIVDLTREFLWDVEVNFLIHCEMGVSRSNAVARWMQSFMGGGIFFDTFDTSDPTESPEGNRHVTRMLEQVWGERANG